MLKPSVGASVLLHYYFNVSPVIVTVVCKASASGVKDYEKILLLIVLKMFLAPTVVQKTCSLELKTKGQIKIIIILKITL